MESQNNKCQHNQPVSLVNPHLITPKSAISTPREIRVSFLGVKIEDLRSIQRGTHKIRVQTSSMPLITELLFLQQMVRDQDHYLPAVGSIPAITDISSPSSPFTQYRCHGLWYIAVLSIPAVLFVVYLGFHLKRNIKKLNRRRSHVMIAYYALLWLSAILNLAWCSLQVTFLVLF